MKICVVGGTGNISSSIVKLLLQQKHEVVCFNRGLSDKPFEGARVIIGDRKDQNKFEKIMQSESFDVAIDMLCFNANHALSSLRAFKGVSHFIMCSTVCTYGTNFNTFPTNETSPINPSSGYARNKAEADEVFKEAYIKDKFPVTIIKPSTTYGPKLGLLRQVGSQDFSWIDRIRKGKPIIVCGDGKAMHQFMHVDDAALAFAGIINRKKCIGETYNLVNDGFITWSEYHKIAMKVIGREVNIVGVPYENLEKLRVPGFDLCREIFSHHSYCTAKKLLNDVPEFKPKISIEEGMNKVIEDLDKKKRIVDSDNENWEDIVIKKQSSLKRNFYFKLMKKISKIKKKIKGKK